MKSLQLLTDLRLKALLKKARTEEEKIPDGMVPGLSIRLFQRGAANWSLNFRVKGEGGVNRHGKQILGKKHSISLGNYPDVPIASARATALAVVADAKQGINPKRAMSGAATAGGLTVEALSKEFMIHHVISRELDSANKYRNSFDVHINPRVGKKLAELLTRDEARQVMERARQKRARPDGRPGAQIGGVEAARTAIEVFRQMYAWAILEGKVRRRDNPCTMMTKNLPRKKKGEVILTLAEARIVWRAAELCGYPFGTQAQLQLLTSLRLDNWASAEEDWIDVKEALSVIPAESYKSDHVHILPLVPQALKVLEGVPNRTTGRYLLSSTGGSKPIVGMAKFYQTRLRDQIIAINGEPIPKRITSQTLRRTVASGIAEILGFEGEKLIKRVLGHSDGSVTAIYNRYVQDFL